MATMERLSEDNIKKAKQWLSDQYLALDFECGDMPHILGVLSKALRAQQERENPKPLTLEELKERAGKPAWIATERRGGWHIVHSFHSADVIGRSFIMTSKTAEKTPISI
jgi:hypothetical protein